MGERILVVDDDARNRRLLDALLRPEGYDVLEADSGEGAVAMVERGGIDLVLLDVMMPGIDGIEAGRRIRASERGRVLPLVFVTALEDREARVRGKMVGGDDYLTKPIDADELRARVRVLLDAKAYHDLREQQRAELEEELQRRSAQLMHAERLATLGTLAGGVGHELNNILAVFEGRLYFAVERAEAGEPASMDDLTPLLRVCEHLKVHAQHLLTLGRPGPAHAEQLDLREIVSTTLSMLHTIGRTKYVELHAALPDRPLMVTVNRTRVEQVLVNLINNAVDALELLRGRTACLDVEIVLDAVGRVICEVRDNGPGIPEARLGQVTEPYFTTKPAGRGTGLGLAVVKQIVETYGGQLIITSVEGEGTVVRFDLPSAAAGGAA